MTAEAPVGRVYLVGAGPGAIDLVTLRAQALIREADVLIYDYLCNPALLEWAPNGAEKIYVGKQAGAHTLSQEEINVLLVQRGRSGQRVVRLKGGDPYVFGRGGEEGLALAEAGVAFEVVPGVTSAIAAAAYAGIPVTHRGVASTVTFITGHEDPTKPDTAIDWKHLAGLRGTKVFLMGLEKLPEITQRLIAEGADPSTPAALVRWGTMPWQESLEGTLATVANLAEKHGFAPPALTIIGDVVNLRRKLNWFEALPLHGKRVVVTRTRRQASVLSERLARLGADVLEIPTIRIQSTALPKEALAQLAMLPNFYKWLVFTSPNAVTNFFQQYDELKLDMRSLGDIKIAAVGPATTRAIEQRRLHVELMPEVYTAENLAKTFSEKNIAGVRFCLPQGNLADPLLATSLRERGAQVDEWQVYETRSETDDATGARARFLREGAHWITFTSASTVHNWHALQLSPAPSAPIPRIISMGPLTSVALKSLGYEIAGEAPSSEMDTLIATLLQLSVT